MFLAKIQLIVTCAILYAMAGYSQSNSNAIVAEGVTPQRVSDAFSFSEGPEVDAKGDVYFTDQPNGIVGTPDGKHLYVAEARANRILKYDIQPDGLLTNRKVFADMGTANVCFGGKERDVLFITASKSVYTLKMLVHGVR